MPTHWESSKRPLFVRTVLVNGSRHAILSQEDPHCPLAGPSSRKQSRPSSCQSYASTASARSCSSRRSLEEDVRRPVKTTASNDLQGCIVKLRLVLASHEAKVKTNSEKGSAVQQEQRKTTKPKPTTHKQKRKKSNVSKTSRKKSLHVQVNGPNTESQVYHEATKYYTYDTNQSIADEAAYYVVETSSDISNSSEKEEPKAVCCCEALTTATATEEKQQEAFPYIKDVPPPCKGLHNDIPWNSVSADSYFTRPYYNPLSERVMQWLDLASRRTRTIDKPDRNTGEVALENIERICEGRTFLDENNMSRDKDRSKPRKQKMLRSRSEVKIVKREVSPEKLPKEPSKEIVGPTEEEDVEEEVKNEEDVETALSSECHQYPRYSKELNKIHSLKSTDNTTETESEVQEACRQQSERRGVLVRQPRLDDDSDDEHYLTRYSNRSQTLRQRRTAFSHRNSLFNKTVDCTPSGKTRRETLKRTKQKTETETSTEPQRTLEVQCKPICQPALLSPRLHNRIPWLKDYQTGGKNMWPSDRATSKPQLHIFMPAMPARTPDGGVEEESMSDCESVTSETCNTTPKP